jgi:RNA polymerase sigma factor (sigma-70 family)
MSDVPSQAQAATGLKSAFGAEALAGSTPEFDLAAVMRQYESALLRYVGQLLGSRYDEAQDVVQEVFIRLHRQVTGSGTRSIDNLRCWLYRVSHNLAMDVGRKRRRRHCLQEQIMSDPVINETGVVTSAGPDAAEAAEHHETCALAVAELQSLPEEQKSVILLKVIHGLTLRETGEITGLKIGTVNYRLTQGLQTLAKRLKARGAIP